MLIKDNDFSQDHGWVKGQNDRTKQTGAVPIDAITILPTLSKPTNEVMVRSSQSNQNKRESTYNWPNFGKKKKPEKLVIWNIFMISYIYI